MHFPRNGHHFKFDDYFRSCIIYFKSETFLIPNLTLVDISIGLLQEIDLCRCLKRFFLNQIAAILELAANLYL